MTSPLKDKWVLITGASSGFGAAAAHAFAAQGARLLLGARRLDRLQQVAGQARKAGAAEARFHALDVSLTLSVNAFVAWARETISPAQPSSAHLDVLINNAGGAQGLDPSRKARTRTGRRCSKAMCWASCA